MRWYKIKDHPNYMISKCGKVLSKKTGKCLKQSVHESGCLVVNFWKKNRFKTIRAHRIVAETFIKNPKNKKTVNHKNGNRLDNRVKNLEWATQSENNQHAYDILKKRPSFLGKFGKDHCRSKPVNMIDEDGAVIASFESANMAQVVCGLPNGVGKAALRGCRAHGLRWEYV